MADKMGILRGIWCTGLYGGLFSVNTVFTLTLKKMKDRIKSRCDRIEKELDAIKQAAIEREFNIEEMLSLTELQHYTAAKYPQIKRYVKRDKK
jgi:hypothetical protein